MPENAQSNNQTSKEQTIATLKVIGKVLLRILSYVGNILLTALIIVLICGIIVGTVFCLYIKDYVNPEIDSSLFAAAASDTTTRMYYMEYESEEERINGMGTPVEIEDQRLFSSDNSIWVSYESIPKDLVNAFTSIEDHRFFEHNGVDWIRTGSAVVTYFFGAGDFGGSTITQQLVKNLTGENENTIQRKVQEICRALNLEKEMSKEEILEMYMNIVYLGNNCYGVQAASNFYFNKDVSELNLVECASLAAIVKNPSKYEPLYHDREIFYENEDGEMEEDDNYARRGDVLWTMWQYDKISKEQFDVAVEEDLVMNGSLEGDEKKSTSNVNTWYTDAVIEDVKKALVAEYGYSDYVASLMIYTGGLQIYTCMDPEVQSVIDEVYTHDKKDQGYFPFANDGLQPESAMVIVDPYTNDVLGLAGGRGEKTQSRVLNRATQATRPCGSSIKPLSVYAPAIDTGTATMGSVYDDCPVTTSSDGSMWPHNLPDEYNGYTTVQDAIRRSVNTCAIKILNDVGIDYSFNFLQNTLNFHSIIDSYTTASGAIITDRAQAPLGLGQFSYGITLWELTAGYSIFDNDGVYCKSRLWTKVLDSDGNVVLSNDPEYEIAISEEAASIMTIMMENVVSWGTATSVTVDEMVDVAGKTGTTTADFDRTFIGFTPYYVGGVWVGYDMNQALSDFGVNPAIAIWDKVFTILQTKINAKAAADGTPVKQFTYSENIVKATYCKDSGKLITDACEHDLRGSRAESAWFTYDTMPVEECDCHVMVKYDTVTHAVATDNCPKDNVKEVALVRNENRSFLTQVQISDAEYVYRSFDPSIGYSDSRMQPYFIKGVDDGTYVGYSWGEIQYNSICTEHLKKKK